MPEITIEPAAPTERWVTVNITTDGKTRQVEVPRGSLFADRPRYTAAAPAVAQVAPSH